MDMITSAGRIFSPSAAAAVGYGEQGNRNRNCMEPVAHTLGREHGQKVRVASLYSKQLAGILKCIAKLTAFSSAILSVASLQLGDGF